MKIEFNMGRWGLTMVKLCMVLVLVGIVWGLAMNVCAWLKRLFPWGKRRTFETCLMGERREVVCQKSLDVSVYKGDPVYVDVPPKPVGYGEASAIVSCGVYSQWMDSIRAQLPKDVEIGYDVTAYVTFHGPGLNKVVWRARTPRGGEYLKVMLGSLCRVELPEPAKKLEAPNGDTSEKSDSVVSTSSSG